MRSCDALCEPSRMRFVRASAKEWMKRLELERRSTYTPWDEGIPIAAVSALFIKW